MSLRKSLLSLSFMLFSTQAFCDSYQGYVSSVFAYNGKIFVSISKGNFDSTSICNTQSNFISLWLDPAQDYDKAIVSMALTAKASEKLVWVMGNNNCIDGPTGKSVKLSAMDLKN